LFGGTAVGFTLLPSDWGARTHFRKIPKFFCPSPLSPFDQ
jgi:hypothetical protein